VPEVLATIYQGGETLDYADRIIALVESPGKRPAAPEERVRTDESQF